MGPLSAAAPANGALLKPMSISPPRLESHTLYIILWGGGALLLFLGMTP